jgi:hypothetical protein
MGDRRVTGVTLPIDWPVITIVLGLLGRPPLYTSPAAQFKEPVEGWSLQQKTQIVAAHGCPGFANERRQPKERSSSSDTRW